MELTIEQALQQGVSAHQDGKFQEAERLYRSILQSQPLHPDANHNLGVLAVSGNKVDAALPLFKTALEANPKIEQFWLSYIDALIKKKWFEDAKQILEQGKKLGFSKEKLNSLEAQLISINEIENVSRLSPSQQQLNNLLDYYQTGRFDNAEKLAVSITQQFPKHQFGWKVLGLILGQTGRNNEAENACQKVVELSPQDADAHLNLGVTLNALGRLDEAEISYTQAIGLKPDYAEAHNNLGNTLKELGRLNEAEASYTEAIALKPDYAKAHSNLGIMFYELGRLDEAETSYTQAIALKSDYAEVHNSLGITLKALGRLEEAETSYTQAIVLKSDYAEAHSNLGITLQAMGRLGEAEGSYRQAISLKSDYAEAHNNLGNALKELGRLEEAELSYTQAIVLKPDYAEAFWNLSGCAKTIKGAEHYIDKCLKADVNYKIARLTKAALRFYQGDRDDFDNLMQSKLKQHPFMRSFSWVFRLPNLPELHFNRWSFFDAIVKKSIISKPFYEFGVWRALSFKYLIKVFKKGYGFDTFTGLPEDWHVGLHIEKEGTYSSDGNIPEIEGGKFIIGEFEDTLPVFFSEVRPMASLINFDADLYSSTLCALNFSKPVIDKDTVLVFDEFIMNESWEQDEFRALNEFCSINHCSYEVLAISFFTKQVAVKLIDI